MKCHVECCVVTHSFRNKAWQKKRYKRMTVWIIYFQTINDQNKCSSFNIYWLDTLTFLQKITFFVFVKCIWASFIEIYAACTYQITGPLKNAIDWASRSPNVWQDKPAAIMSAGGAFGGGRSQYHLRQVGVFLDLHFINKPELFVQAFQPPQKFDSEGNLIDPETKERVKNLLLSLYAFTLRLKNTCWFA